MPQREEVTTFMVEDARIIFRNFAGREGPYNDAGVRSFAVVLNDKTADQMLKDGWNVKWPRPDDDGNIGDPFISVAVRFDIFPPRVVMMTSKARTPLTEDTIEVLDWANIANVDLICRAYNWTVGDKGGIKAYLKSLFVTIEEDYLERKYAINEVDV